jgi:hypothetical protein
MSQGFEQKLAIFKRVDRCVEALVAACRFAVPWLNLGEKRVVGTNEGGLYAREYGTGNAWLLARYEYQSERRTEAVLRAVQWLCKCPRRATAAERLGKVLYRLQRLIIK